MFRHFNDVRPQAVREVAFVLSDAPEPDRLIEGLRPGVEARLLDAGGDALAQMAEALDGRSDVGVLHLFSHGEPGRLQLGATGLDADGLRARAEVVQAIAAGLAPGAEVLLYGCRVAAGAEGRAFVADFADALGARMAASVTPTGAAEQGGDWRLGWTAGAPAARLALTPVAARSYGGLLGGEAPQVTGLTYETVEVSVGVASPLPDFGVMDPDGDVLHVTLTPGGGVLGGVVDEDPVADGVQLSGLGDALAPVLQGLTFTATANGLATLMIDVSDGDLSGLGSMLLNATGGNVAPSFTGADNLDDPAAVATGVATALPDFTVADPDGDTLTLTLIPWSGELGGLTDADPVADGVQLTGSAAEINAALAGATFKADADGSVSIQMSLDDGHQDFPTWGWFWMDASGANAAPTIGGLTLDDVEVRVGVAAALPDFTVADADDDTLTVTLDPYTGQIGGVTDADAEADGVQLTGTASQINALLANATYTASQGGTQVIRVEVTDGHVTDSVIDWINVSAQANHAPTISGVPSEAAAVTIGEAAALPDIAVADADGDPLTVTLTAENGALGGLTDADPDTDGVQLTGTAAQINDALKDATFTAAGAGAASVTISVDDGLAATPASKTLSLSAGEPAQQAPVLDGLGDGATFTEDAPDGVALVPSITVADADSAALAEARVVITDVQPGDELLFEGGPAAGPIEASYVAATGTLTLTGPATAAQFQAALRAVSYHSSAGEPAAGDRHIEIQVSDGTSTSATASATVTVVAVNDAPLGADHAESLAYDGLVVLGQAAFPFLDAEGDPLQSVVITSLPTAGRLELDHVAVTAGQEIAVADIDAGKLTFRPGLGASPGPYASLTFQVRAGGALDAQADTLTFTIDRGPAPPPAGPDPDPPAQTVDGVPVSTSTTTQPDGSVTQTVIVPVVTGSRVDSVGGGSVADIPLVTADGGQVLTAQVPAGFGLEVTGAAQPKGAGASLADLIHEIEAHTSSGSTDQTTLTGGGSGFLSSMPADAPLIVQTVTPTVATDGTAPAHPLVIQGSADPQAPATALVIDVHGLPPGTEIQLQHVDFAAIVGAVKVSGGDGSQTVFGDGAAQQIVLGADDDVLHGGAGDDTVGSAGGDDRLFGDDGHDVVFGGVGNDLVQGNAGADTVNGGDGDDHVYGGKDADRVYGDAGADVLNGDLGDDFAQGNTGADLLDGGDGADTLLGGQDGDRVFGGAGHDLVLGDTGDDVIQGGTGDDTVSGGDGADVARGGQGADLVQGGAGDDWLAGDLGDDTLAGGAGADVFHTFAGAGVDRILDFSRAEGDRVQLAPGQHYTLLQDGADAVVDLGDGTRLILVDVQLNTLGDGWLFAA